MSQRPQPAPSLAQQETHKQQLRSMSAIGRRRARRVGVTARNGERSAGGEKSALPFIDRAGLSAPATAARNLGQHQDQGPGPVSAKHRCRALGWTSRRTLRRRPFQRRSCFFIRGGARRARPLGLGSDLVDSDGGQVLPSLSFFLWTLQRASHATATELTHGSLLTCTR